MQQGSFKFKSLSIRTAHQLLPCCISQADIKHQVMQGFAITSYGRAWLASL